jgi:hypothetical protein
LAFGSNDFSQAAGSLNTSGNASGNATFEVACGSAAGLGEWGTEKFGLLETLNQFISSLRFPW